MAKKKKKRGAKGRYAKTAKMSAGAKTRRRRGASGRFSKRKRTAGKGHVPLTVLRKRLPRLIAAIRRAEGD